jgi:hypothetical protein
MAKSPACAVSFFFSRDSTRAFFSRFRSRHQKPPVPLSRNHDKAHPRAHSPRASPCAAAKSSVVVRDTSRGGVRKTRGSRVACNLASAGVPGHRASRRSPRNIAFFADIDTLPNRRHEQSGQRHPRGGDGRELRAEPRRYASARLSRRATRATVIAPRVSARSPNPPAPCRPAFRHSPEIAFGD